MFGLETRGITTTKVTIDKELFEDLLESKLAAILEKIESILKKWQYESADLFLKHAADGTLDDAEPDAISLTNLLDSREDLEKIRLTAM